MQPSNPILLEALAQVGVVAAAVPDAVRRAEVHFQDLDPDAQTLTQWAESLKTSAPHFFPVATRPVELYPSWMSPEERLARYRQDHPTPPRRKPPAYRPTPAQQQALDQMSDPQAKLTAYRQMAAEAAQGKE